jgi:hypothetical protein
MKPMTEGTSALALNEVLTPDQEAALALQSAMEVLTIAKAVVVKTDQDYRAADDAVTAIKAAMKKADAKRDELVRPLNTVVKKINAQFKDVVSTFENALAAYRGPMTQFQMELARQRREAEEAARKEQEHLQAIAREEARKAEEVAAQARREADEAARRAQEAAVDPFEAALAQQEADDAQRAAQASMEAAQQSIRDVRKVEVIPEFTQKVTGAGSKTFTIWDFEVTDPDLVPMKYRPIDFKLIEKDVRELKGECRIPGVEVSSHIEVK